MASSAYNRTYLTEMGEKYPVRVIKEYGNYYDVEIDPSIEDMTLLKVAKYFILPK